MKIKTIKQLEKVIENSPARSAWSRGVRDFAVDLVCNLKDSFRNDEVKELFEEPKILHKILLNGAADWDHYSWRGLCIRQNVLL